MGCESELMHWMGLDMVEFGVECWVVERALGAKVDIPRLWALSLQHIPMERPNIFEAINY